MDVTNRELHAALEWETERHWEPYHTGGGVHVIETRDPQSQRFVWLTRDDEWLLGFYNDQDDDGAVVTIHTRDDNDAQAVAEEVAAILSRTIYAK